MSDTNKLNQLDFLNETFTALETGKKDINTATKQILSSDTVVDKVTATIEANIVANNSKFGNKYAETFETNLLNQLGIDNDERKKQGKNPFKLQVLSDAEYKNVLENFDQTVNTTSGSNVALPQITKTNFSNLLNQIFFETSIFSDVTSYADGPDNETIREILNVRTATSGNETLSATYADDTVDEITLNPNFNRVVDAQLVTRNFEMSKNSIDASTLIAMKLRSVGRQAEKLIFGSNSGTTQAAFQTLGNMGTITPNSRNGQVYSLLNSLAVSGVNRGARILNPIGVGNANHLDALAWMAQNTRGIKSIRDMKGMAHYMNLNTALSVVRTINNTGGNMYYYDKLNDTITSILLNIPIKIVDDNTLLDWQVVTGKMSDFRIKKLGGINFESRVTSLKDNKLEIIAELMFDGAPINAFKNIPSKNNFTAMLLEADGNYAS